MHLFLKKIYRKNPFPKIYRINQCEVLSIESFCFENFKGIKNTEVKNLPEGAPWILLTGENGAGKTSILQALATCFASMDELNFLPIHLKHHVNNRCKIHGTSEEYKLKHL